MVDIHCHPLPGIDDGAKSFEMSEAMLAMAAADGTTHLVATPHCNAMYEFSLEHNQELVRQLTARPGPKPELFCGCDFHLSYENLERAQVDSHPFTLNQKNYLLIEFANYGIAPQMGEMLHRLRVRGVTPIVTHPERNPLLSREPFDFLRQLVEMGCPIQITANSLTGRFGHRAQHAARRLFEARMAHFIASDAHDLDSRPPKLSAARAAVAETWGEEVAQAVSEGNPRAALEGRPLPYFPEPVPLAPLRRKKRFWFF